MSIIYYRKAKQNIPLCECTEYKGNFLQIIISVHKCAQKNTKGKMKYDQFENL